MNTLYQQTRDAVRRHRTAAENTLAAAGDEFAPLLDALRQQVTIDDRPLTLAVAGEYSVGKSSIIKALTGHDIAVGAGPTTDAVRSYPYQDLVLVDMPGALSGQMEHDEVARVAITDADLILFVVSNELFNAESLPFFRFAAERLAKQHQMLLVVNKFDRFNPAGRTTEESVRFIGATLAEQIRPLPLDAFGPATVSAQDYLASRQTNDPVKSRRRLEDSRFQEFFATIDEFTARRGLLAQQARPLQQLLVTLEGATSLALADDGSRARAEALVRRRIFVLTEARGLARSEFRRIRESARARLLKPLEPLLKRMDDKASPEEMDAAGVHAENEVERATKAVYHELDVLRGRLAADLREQLDEIDRSPLAAEVAAEFSARVATPPIDPGVILSGKQRKVIAGGLKDFGQYLAKNSKEVADALGQAFKFFGGKFKPYGKVKLGKFLGKAGKVIGPLAALGEAYLNYREEVHKEEAERKLRAVRTQQREQFMDICDQFDASLAEQERTLVEKLYNEPLAVADEQVRGVLSGAQARARVAQEVQSLMRVVRNDLDRLHC